MLRLTPFDISYCSFLDMPKLSGRLCEEQTLLFWKKFKQFYYLLLEITKYVWAFKQKGALCRSFQLSCSQSYRSQVPTAEPGQKRQWL